MTLILLVGIPLRGAANILSGLMLRALKTVENQELLHQDHFEEYDDMAD
jgi:hypothetical protein